MIFKVFWIIRAIFNKPFFGQLKLPSYLGRPVYIKGASNIFIGRKVRIFPNIRLETHFEGKIVIKDNVGIAQNVHITAMGDLEIGEGSTILANVYITDIKHCYTEIGKPILDQPLIYESTKIGSNCFVGMGACIQAGTVLGNQCIVGANSVVKGNFPDNCVLAGVPAKIIKRYDSESGSWVKIK